MGFFRFFLASLVLVSHMGYTVFGLNPGVAAVVVFYLLAGQVVCRLWLRQSQLDFGQKVQWFYTDRAWRILPMYGFVLVVAVCAWLLGAESYFLSSSPEASDWLNNVLIIPLNYYMFNGADTFTLLPPAWSLAVELQFYLLVPLLLAHRVAMLAAFSASIAVFCFAQTTVLNTDIFGYRLLVGIGFLFICGCWLSLRSHSKLRSKQQAAITALWACAGVYSLILLLFPEYRQPYNTEVAFGFFVGLPAVLLFSRRKTRGLIKQGEKLAGALSYGVFLAHFPVIWLLELWLPEYAQSVTAVLLGSTMIALSGHFLVERPLWQRFRIVVPPAKQSLKQPGSTFSPR